MSEGEVARRFRREWVFAGVGLVVALVIGAGGVRMWAHERVLDQRGVVTEAEVINVVPSSIPRPRSAPDVAVVRYPVAGETIEADLMVSSSGRFESGDRIAIEYDPENPGHARPLVGWEPTYRIVLALSALLVVLLVGGVVAGRHHIRQSAAAVNSGRDDPAHAVLYTRWRWSWPSGEVDHLVGLWPEGSPGHEPPPYSVALASRFDLDKVRDGPVRVLGGLEAGNHVVLLFGSRRLETSGGVKRGLARRAKRVERELSERRWPLRLHPRDPRGHR